MIRSISRMIVAGVAVAIALVAYPGGALADADEGATYGGHVVHCAQSVGFDGVHNPGMHNGYAGWNPAHSC